MKGENFNFRANFRKSGATGFQIKTLPHSHIERETLALMRREPPGAAMRHACEDFEKFWASAIAGQPRGKLVNPEVEETCKRIARHAFLEGRRL